MQVSDGKPSLSSNSQYDVCFSLTTKRRARSLTFSTEMSSLRTVVKVRKDESKVYTLSCFKWKDLFHSLEYRDLLGDFSAYICYVPLEFHFVVYGKTKHCQISSNGNSSVFAVEMWYYTCDFPITIA